MHRVTLSILLSAALSLSAFSLVRADQGRGDDEREHARKHHRVQRQTILEARTMAGVDGAFVGEAFPVRGVPGDGLPWTAPRKTFVRLSSDGKLVIAVRGLVIEDDEDVPENLRGINPDATFRGLVSCLSGEGDAVVERNVTTDPFPANEQGNSLIVDTIELPNPCVAPIVMVLAGDRDQWFSMTGFEMEEDDGE